MVAYVLALIALFILSFYGFPKIKKLRHKDVNISFEKVTVKLMKEDNGIRVISKDINVIFRYQNYDTLLSILNKNFPIVNEYYKNIVGPNLNRMIEVVDINLISLNIILAFFYIENMSRIKRNKFNEFDYLIDKNELKSSYTYDQIIGFLKNKYPNDWREKCSVIIGLTLEGFNALYEERKLFYNR